MLETKSGRYDEILHELDESRQLFVLRPDEVYRLKLGVVVGALGHKKRVTARRGRHKTYEVGTDDLNPLHDVNLARLGEKLLFDVVLYLVNVARGPHVGEIDSHLGHILRALHSALVWLPEARVPDVLV